MKYNPMGKVRVVTGSARGLWLDLPPNFPSRPTQDRVKQAIFSALGSRVIDANMLDIFAGSGSLGIEALSRGAASGTFVDESHDCARTIGKNLEHCSLAGRVVALPVEKFLLQPPQSPLFDLVLADPPYVKGEFDLHKQKWLTLLVPHTAPDALLVFEHHFKNAWKEHPDWQLLKQSKYGETTVTTLGRQSSSSGGGTAADS